MAPVRWWHRMWAAWIAAAMLMAGGCGTPYAVRHRVRDGETLSSIASAYGVEEAALRRFNRLGPGDKVRPGDLVFVPGERRAGARGKSGAKAVQSGPEKPSAGGAPQGASPTPVRKGAPRFRWPAEGKLLRGFGGPEGNRGIDLAAPEGTAVRAAASGEVVYAGVPASAYRGIVILRHTGGLHTVYGNLEEVSVRRGQRIKAGDEVGRSGGPARGLPAHVHFEVRRGERPLDPVLFLDRR